MCIPGRVVIYDYRLVFLGVFELEWRDCPSWAVRIRRTVQIGANGYRKAKHDTMLSRRVECTMKYKSGYRYKLDEVYVHELSFNAFDAKQIGAWVSLVDSRLVISNGYAWDGASSGLPWTPKKWIRPSLVHDALYQLIREGQLPMERREDADMVFYQLMRENQVNVIVAFTAYLAVRVFGNYCLRKGKKTKEAP